MELPVPPPPFTLPRTGDRPTPAPMIGEEEKKIRKDPVGTGSDILKKVFGVLK